MTPAEARQSGAARAARYALDDLPEDRDTPSGDRQSTEPLFGAGALIDGARTAFWTPLADEDAHRRYVTSVSFHVLLIGAIYAASLHLAPPPAQEQPIELVMETQAPPPPTPTPVKAEEPPPPPPAAEEAVAPVKPKPPKPKPTHIAKRISKPAPAAPQVAQTTAPVAPVASQGPKVLPSSYAARVYEKVSHAASGNYPRAAIARELEGRVAYTLILDPSGNLIRYSVDPSGKEIFDRAAAQAIEKAAPYPTPPNLGATAYQLHGVIAYQLADE